MYQFSARSEGIVHFSTSSQEKYLEFVEEKSHLGVPAWGSSNASGTCDIVVRS